MIRMRRALFEMQTWLGTSNIAASQNTKLTSVNMIDDIERKNLVPSPKPIF